MGVDLIFVFVVAPLVLLVAAGAGLYMSDPKGWKATGRRISTWTRANLESGKAPKELTKGVTSKDLIADWDNQFESKDLAVTKGPEKKHEIVKTRLRPLSQPMYGYTHWYSWKCRCGATGEEVSQDSALKSFNQHIAAFKKQDELDRIKEEYKRKGLDREW